MADLMPATAEPVRGGVGHPGEDDAVLAAARRYVSPSMRIAFPPLTVHGGEGAWIWDRGGRRYLDLHSMAGIMNVGHGHPRVVEAVERQARQLLHVNPAYAVHSTVTTLAERLGALTPGTFDKRVVFGLSGSDANDGAIKLARAATGRQVVVAFEGAYHGNTYGALSLSAISPAMRRGFGPTLPGVVHVRYPDSARSRTVGPAQHARDCLAELERTVALLGPADQVAAVVVEPVQGDSGVVVPPAEFMTGLAEFTRRNGVLLISEEVQTGIGRTGRVLGIEHFGVVPDVVVLGKALGGGMPVSAVVARSELMDAWTAPGHVFSTSANPVCSAAALAALDVLEEEGLAEAARTTGARLRAGLEHLATDLDCLGEIRGLGLMLGVELVTGDGPTRDHLLAAKVIKGCFDRGCFLTFLAGSVLRFIPPLVITPDEVDTALTILEESLRAALDGSVSDDEVADLVGW